jgi:hypothetical protein
VLLGTGKTVTAIKIAYWFAQLNAKSEAGASKRQVLYCGPSNSAVDVAMSEILYMLHYVQT